MFLDGSRPEFRKRVNLGCVHYLDENEVIRQPQDINPKPALLAAQRCVHMHVRFDLPN